ncbi:hypothetical protein [Methylosinus sp. Ce-a6]|uniref:hypothetical protein n=1 Tax=Methylosinus sp. Ce-a6 TaxID=2172005 RepID=UPI001356B30F|nr:hypothetical protein [Methylosinus sp. Ce-a6]
MPTCADCRHWDNSETARGNDFGATGLCRRAAPFVDFRTGLGAWPFAFADDRCGEHSPIVRWPRDLTRRRDPDDDLPF